MVRRYYRAFIQIVVCLVAVSVIASKNPQSSEEESRQELTELDLSGIQTQPDSALTFIGDTHKTHSASDLRGSEAAYANTRTKYSHYTSNNSDFDDENGDNCSSPRNPEPHYNSSCELVHAECGEKTQLIDYIALVLCDLIHVQPLGYVLMALWLVYLISLLATTVDNFFVPPLNFLAEKLKLSPSIAGITLLALGNAAPDIFVVYSGVAQDDLALVLGALAGGVMFITTVVLGSVILVSKVNTYKIDRIDFMRDIVALISVLGTIIAVAFDGVVYLAEACIFPLLYMIYIAAVIGINYFRGWLRKRSHIALDEELACDEDAAERSVSLERSLPMKRVTVSIKAEKTEHKPFADNEKNKVELSGLTWPRGAHIVFKIIWVIQWPFSLLRWMSVPPSCHDGKWSKWHFCFAVCSPVPMAMTLLIAIKGWSGFTIVVGEMHLPTILVIVGIFLSILLFFALSSKKPPHWIMQTLLVPAAFCMAIVWLNIEANEVVSVLKAFGLLLNIDTAILGLTVLAVGNSVADWVADTVIARCGKPEMAFASCFGSPLMSNVVGISIAFIVKIAIYNNGEPYRYLVHTPDYSQVKLAWIFLGTSLIASAAVFPLSRFSPPRLYGPVLMIIYAVFVVVAVLAEVGLIPVNL